MIKINVSLFGILPYQSAIVNKIQHKGNTQTLRKSLSPNQQQSPQQRFLQRPYQRKCADMVCWSSKKQGLRDDNLQFINATYMKLLTFMGCQFSQFFSHNVMECDHGIKQVFPLLIVLISEAAFTDINKKMKKICNYGCYQ